VHIKNQEDPEKFIHFLTGVVSAGHVGYFRRRDQWLFHELFSYPRQHKSKFTMIVDYPFLVDGHENNQTILVL